MSDRDSPEWRLAARRLGRQLARRGAGPDAVLDALPADAPPALVRLAEIGWAEAMAAAPFGGAAIGARAGGDDRRVLH